MERAGNRLGAERAVAVRVEPGRERGPAGGADQGVEVVPAAWGRPPGRGERSVRGARAAARVPRADVLPKGSASPCIRRGRRWRRPGVAVKGFDRRHPPRAGCGPWRASRRAGRRLLRASSRAGRVHCVCGLLRGDAGAGSRWSGRAREQKRSAAKAFARSTSRGRAGNPFSVSMVLPVRDRGTEEPIQRLGECADIEKVVRIRHSQGSCRIRGEQAGLEPWLAFTPFFEPEVVSPGRQENPAGDRSERSPFCSSH